MLILGIGAGLRNSLSPELVFPLVESPDLQRLETALSKMVEQHPMSNSELGLVLTLWSAKKAGAECVEFLQLREIFENAEQLNHLEEYIRKCHGICLSTPLYFGNPSSYYGDFSEWLRRQKDNGNVLLEGKAVASVSVGGRWNGGQQSANIFLLNDLLELGAMIVGNGAPSSQCGGTVTARYVGDALEDSNGMRTCTEVGERLVQAIQVIHSHSSNDKGKSTTRILVLVATKEHHSELREIFESQKIGKTTDLDFIDVWRLVNLEHCRACTRCPYHPATEGYGCIINDEFADLHQRIVSADGIVVAGHFSFVAEGRKAFQFFAERIRYLRRDNYRLAHIPVAFVQILEAIDNSHFVMRAIPTLLKHNTILAGPPLTYRTNSCSPSDLHEIGTLLSQLSVLAHKVAIGRKSAPPSIYSV